jgi:hypothetical protein
MPGQVHTDRDSARQYERMLRHDAAYSANRWELEWFEAQPLHVQQSWRLLCPARESAECAHQAEQAQRVQRTSTTPSRAERLAAAQVQPRDLSCLHIEGAKAWTGIGRRKRRCRTFWATGHAFASRYHLLPAPEVAVVMGVEIDDLPTRPPTPEGLRLSLYNSISLLALAAYNDHTYGWTTPVSGTPTPESSSPNPTPPPLPCIFSEYQLSVPLSLEGPYSTPDGTAVVDGGLVSVVSIGRHSVTPWLAIDYASIVQSLEESEAQSTGGLMHLYGTLFPGHLFDPASALMPTQAMMELCHGWLWAMEAFLTGQAPRPKRVCLCGGLVP